MVIFDLKTIIVFQKVITLHLVYFPMVSKLISISIGGFSRNGSAVSRVHKRDHRSVMSRGDSGSNS